MFTFLQNMSLPYGVSMFVATIQSCVPGSEPHNVLLLHGHLLSHQMKCFDGAFYVLPPVYKYYW